MLVLRLKLNLGAAGVHYRLCGNFSETKISQLFQACSLFRHLMFRGKPEVKEVAGIPNTQELIIKTLAFSFLPDSSSTVCTLWTRHSLRIFTNEWACSECPDRPWWLSWMSQTLDWDFSCKIPTVGFKFSLRKCSFPSNVHFLQMFLKANISARTADASEWWREQIQNEVIKTEHAQNSLWYLNSCRRNPVQELHWVTIQIIIPQAFHSTSHQHSYQEEHPAQRCLQRASCYHCFPHIWETTHSM